MVISTVELKIFRTFNSEYKNRSCPLAARAERSLVLKEHPNSQKLPFFYVEVSKIPYEIPEELLSCKARERLNLNQTTTTAITKTANRQTDQSQRAQYVERGKPLVGAEEEGEELEERDDDDGEVEHVPQVEDVG